MKRTLRLLAVLAMVALISVISAGCGSNERSDTGAATGSGTPAGSSGSASSSGSANSSGTGGNSGIGGNKNLTARDKAVKFAECIRAHGVRDFPDPVNGEPIVDTYEIPSADRPGGMTCG